MRLLFSLKSLDHTVNNLHTDEKANVSVNNLPAFPSIFRNKCLPCPSKQFPPFLFKTQLSVEKSGKYAVRKIKIKAANFFTDDIC
jgi:hypothetical protein